MDSPSFFSAETSPLELRQQDQDCYFNIWEPYQPTSSCASDDYDVARPNGCSSVYGEGPGVARIEARWYVDSWYNEPGSGNTYSCSSTTQEIVEEVFCEVRPRVDSLTPSRALIGSTVNVRITGQGLSSNRAGVATTVDAGDGITATVTARTARELDVRFEISPDAAAGNHAVTVRVGFSRSNSRNFFVQIPTSLRVLAQAVFVDPNGCRGPRAIGPNGFQASIRYQVLDQANPAQPISATMPLRENLYNATAGGVPGPGERTDVPITASGSTDSDGTFVDAPIGLCATLPFSSGTLTQEIFVPLSNALRPTVRTNNFVFTGRSNCGNFTNGLDINVSVPCQ